MATHNGDQLMTLSSNNTSSSCTATGSGSNPGTDDEECQSSVAASTGGILNVVVSPVHQNHMNDDGGFESGRQSSTISSIFNKRAEDNKNIDLVDEHLYLGNLTAACDIDLLKTLGIHYILTVDSCPLPNKITDLPLIETKFFQVSDIPKEDIIRYFEESYNFIEKCIQEKNKSVLVHCYFGVSRSSTIVLAYLMKKFELTLDEALARLKSRRSIVCPNYGFLSQLKLYENMKYNIEKNNIFYKRFRLHIAAEKIKSVKVLPPPYTDVIKCDPAPLTVRPEPVVYRCKKCRRILASASNLLTHYESKSPLWFHVNDEKDDIGKESKKTESMYDEKFNQHFNNEDENSKLYKNEDVICRQMYFIEPLAWMSSVVSQNLQGKLYCPNPNCKSKLGSYSWIMGCLCPCGAKVQPAFYLVPSKVDRSTSVLNIQITI